MMMFNETYEYVESARDINNDVKASSDQLIVVDMSMLHLEMRIGLDLVCICRR